MVIKVVVKTLIYPTEDPKKVKKAVKNVFVPISYKVIEKDKNMKMLVAEGYGYTSLIKIYNALRREKILDSARRSLLAGLKGNKIIFALHKQAAYVNVVSFCDFEINPPLGVIEFEVETDKPEDLINWLAPPTKNGVPIKEYPPPI